MGPVHPREGRVRRGPRPLTKVSTKDDGLNHEQGQREQQPHADHRVHPPELHPPEPFPQIEARRHVETGQADDDDPGPRLPDEAVFDHLEGLEPIGAEIAASDRRQTQQ